MWAAQHIKYEGRNTHISSGGLGTMGFGFPAAIGVKMGRPEATVWAVVGDGGFQMTLQELATAVQENIDVNVAVINNGFLGMVRQWQELFHDNRYSSVAMSNPDFVKLAEAYGAKGLRCVHKSDVDRVIREAMAYKGPVVIDFVVESEENVYPIIPSGATAQDLIEEPELLEQVEEAHIIALEGEAPALATDNERRETDRAAQPRDASDTRPLTRAGRDEIISQYLESHPGMGIREAARELGIQHPKIIRLKHVEELIRKWPEAKLIEPGSLDDIVQMPQKYQGQVLDNVLSRRWDRTDVRAARQILTSDSRTEAEKQGVLAAQPGQVRSAVDQATQHSALRTQDSGNGRR